jgi:hypothetical protein
VSIILFLFVPSFAVTARNPVPAIDSRVIPILEIPMIDADKTTNHISMVDFEYVLIV